MAVEPGPGLRSLQRTLGLNESEVNLLAERYPDKELAGPAEFIRLMVTASSNPALSKMLGGKTQNFKEVLQDLLVNVKAVLLSGGPAALDKYLQDHPFMKHLGR